MLEYKYYSIEKKEGLEYKRKQQQHFSSADTMVPYQSLKEVVMH